MYRTIETSIWHDPKFRALPAPAKLLFVYLFSNPHAHVSGIYYVPDVTIIHETGLKQDALDTLWHTLSGAGLVGRDKPNEVVWVRNMMRYQGRGEKLRAAAANHLLTLHNSSLLSDFRKYYPDVSKEAKRRGIDRVSGAGRVSLKEQEQEKEHKKDLSAHADATGEGEGEVDGASKRERKPASGAHHETVRTFCDAWKAKYRAEYRFVDGKDGKHVKWLLGSVGGSVAEVAKAIDAFLADGDQFVAEKRHPIGLLVSGFNKYRADIAAGANGHPPRRKEAAVVIYQNQ